MKTEGKADYVPKLTIFLVLALLVIGIWFFKGQSFRLYASMFFGLYDVTGLIWLSIILVSVLQNIFFLPLQMIGTRVWPKVKEFEAELEKTNTDDQYFVFHKKIQGGDSSIIFYVFNFVLLAIAFFSAGRVFLLDFYSQHNKINSWFLYKFIPYPEYPLNGTIFNFPWFKITKIVSWDWSQIMDMWLWIVGIMVALRLIWWIVRIALKNNAQILKFRIKYNRLLLALGGVAGTILILSTIFLRNIPVGFEYLNLTADLAKQNTVFNIITAIATFFAAIYSGYRHNSEGRRDAIAEGMDKSAVDKVFLNAMKVTMRNGVMLAIFAYVVTHQMPCSHDLSVLSFEFIYVISPLYMNKLTPKKKTALLAPLEENNL